MQLEKSLRYYSQAAEQLQRKKSDKDMTHDPLLVAEVGGAPIVLDSDLLPWEDAEIDGSFFPPLKKGVCLARCLLSVLTSPLTSVGSAWYLILTLCLSGFLRRNSLFQASPGGGVTNGTHSSVHVKKYFIIVCGRFHEGRLLHTYSIQVVANRMTLGFPSGRI